MKLYVMHVRSGAASCYASRFFTHPVTGVTPERLLWKYASGDAGSANTALRVSGWGSLPD